MNARETATQREVASNRTRLGSIALARIRMIGYCDDQFRSQSLCDQSAIKNFVEENHNIVIEWQDPIWRTPELAAKVVEVHLR